MVVRKTKDKCKDAARMRREKERAEFIELSRLLPLPSSTTSQLDKASIIRLTSSYLRMRSAFPEGLGENWGQHKIRRNDHDRQTIKSAGIFTKQFNNHQQQIKELGSLLLQTLDGFVFAMHKDGKIMYISETASVHLGLPQIDLTGSSVYEYVHPSDRDNIKNILNLSETEIDQLNYVHNNNNNSNYTAEEDNNISNNTTDDLLEFGRSFCMRMKCILPKRNAGLVSNGYKAIHCNGYLKVRCNTKKNKIIHQDQEQSREWESYALVAVGHSLLPTASTEVKLTNNSFMFRASLDFKFYYIETIMNDLLGLDQFDMMGKSLYQFVHVEDVQHLEHSHKLLLDKGQVISKYYRLMKRDGGFIWVQSYAILVNNPRNMPKPQHIVSICMILGDDLYDQSCLLYDRNCKTMDDTKRLEDEMSQSTNELFDSSSIEARQITSASKLVSLETNVVLEAKHPSERENNKLNQSVEKKKVRQKTSSSVAKIHQLQSTRAGDSPMLQLQLSQNQHMTQNKRAFLGRQTKTINGDGVAANQQTTIALKNNNYPFHLMPQSQSQSHDQNHSTESRLSFEPLVESYGDYCATTTDNDQLANNHYQSLAPNAIGFSIGSSRRASDDSCSVVSSVASTSVSSRSSTHHSTESADNYLLCGYSLNDNCPLAHDLQYQQQRNVILESCAPIVDSSTQKKSTLSTSLNDQQQINQIWPQDEFSANMIMMDLADNCQHHHNQYNQHHQSIDNQQQQLQQSTNSNQLVQITRISQPWVNRIQMSTHSSFNDLETTCLNMENCVTSSNYNQDHTLQQQQQQQQQHQQHHLHQSSSEIYLETNQAFGGYLNYSPKTIHHPLQIPQSTHLYTV